VTADQQQKNLQNNQTQQINNNEISTKASSANSSLPIKIEAIQKHDDYSQKTTPTSTVTTVVPPTKERSTKEKASKKAQTIS